MERKNRSNANAPLPNPNPPPPQNLPPQNQPPPQNQLPPQNQPPPQPQDDLQQAPLNPRSKTRRNAFTTKPTPVRLKTLESNEDGFIKIERLKSPPKWEAKKDCVSNLVVSLSSGPKITFREFGNGGRSSESPLFQEELVTRKRMLKEALETRGRVEKELEELPPIDAKTDEKSLEKSFDSVFRLLEQLDLAEKHFKGSGKSNATRGKLNQYLLGNGEQERNKILLEMPLELRRKVWNSILKEIAHSPESKITPMQAKGLSLGLLGASPKERGEYVKLLKKRLKHDDQQVADVICEGLEIYSSQRKGIEGVQFVKDTASFPDLQLAVCRKLIAEFTSKLGPSDTGFNRATANPKSRFLNGCGALRPQVRKTLLTPFKNVLKNISEECRKLKAWPESINEQNKILAPIVMNLIPSFVEAFENMEMPRDFSMVLGEAYSSVKEKVGKEKEKGVDWKRSAETEGQSAVGSILFLGAFNLMLTNEVFEGKIPELTGDNPNDKPDPKTTRVLTGLSKLLQGLATQVYLTLDGDNAKEIVIYKEVIEKFGPKFGELLKKFGEDGIRRRQEEEVGRSQAPTSTRRGAPNLTTLLKSFPSELVSEEEKESLLNSDHIKYPETVVAVWDRMASYVQKEREGEKTGTREQNAPDYEGLRNALGRLMDHLDQQEDPSSISFGEEETKFLNEDSISESDQSLGGREGSGIIELEGEELFHSSFGTTEENEGMQILATVKNATGFKDLILSKVMKTDFLEINFEEGKILHERWVKLAEELEEEFKNGEQQINPGENAEFEEEIKKWLLVEDLKLLAGAVSDDFLVVQRICEIIDSDFRKYL